MTDEENERDGLIGVIESSYPIDSKQQNAQEIGRGLLEEAEMNICNWRNLPIPVLKEYARLCIRYAMKEKFKSESVYYGTK